MLRRERAVMLPVAIGLAGALAACLDSKEYVAGNWNIPVVAATGTNLAVTVSAYSFTFDHSYFGPTLGDSVAIGLVVSGYRGGSAQVEIIDSSGVARLQIPVTGNIVEAQGQSTVRGTPPYTVHVRFTNFSGVFVLGVTRRF